MAQTSGSRFVPGYDLFKLVVAVILTIILIILLLRGCQQSPAPATVTPAPPSATATDTPLPPTVTETPVPASATFTPVPPATDTPTATFTAQPPPGDTPTPSPTSTSTPLPAPTEPVPTSDPNACPSAVTRIHVGDSVRVLYRLNFRTGPGLNWPIILTNNPGTRMEVIGGPVCTRRATPGGDRAYLWWKVRLPNGLEGWSAEAPLIRPDYFLEPIR
ncbi:MAG: hypothetical protein ACOYZ8_00725 [Chloroflexota bacterium]